MPSLLPLGVAYVLLAIASVAALVFLRRDAALSDIGALNPFGPLEKSQQFFFDGP